MKKFLLLIAIILLIPLNGFCADNVIPQNVSLKNTNTFGLYQAPDKLTLYEQPSEESHIVHSITFSGGKIFPPEIKADDLFVVFIPSKNLGLLAVSDETEEWVQVIYNNSTGAKGWLKKDDDPYRFMTWVMFYNMYGRKYGLKLLKQAPDSAKDLHTGTDDKSQVVDTINMPQKINLTVIKGNWALVSVYDIDRVPKTGYIRWRSDNGVKYYFPDIK